MKRRPPIYGLLAEFDNPTDLVAAARRVHDYGYKKMDAYSPYPIEELHEAMHLHGNQLPFLVLCGGILGGLGGYFMQYWMSVIDYPIQIGGRPLHSWPSFIPITFETTVLGAALTAVFGMLALNGLPMPYHALASRDRFFICIEAVDPKFDPEVTRRFLETLKPRSIAEVPH
jgi:hypothetical protein